MTQMTHLGSDHTQFENNFSQFQTENSNNAQSRKPNQNHNQLIGNRRFNPHSSGQQ